MGGSRYIRLRFLIVISLLLLTANTVSQDSVIKPSSPVAEAKSVLTGVVLHSWLNSLKSIVLPAGVDIVSEVDHLTLQAMNKLQTFHKHSNYPDQDLSRSIKNEVLLTDHKKPRFLIFSEHQFHQLRDFYVVLAVIYLTFQLGYEMLKRQDTVAPSSVSITARLPKGVACLQSMLNIKGEREVSALFSSDDSSEKHRFEWLFKYQHKMVQSFVAYPAFHDNSMGRLASYSSLSFKKVPVSVSFINLSEAGFRFTGKEFAVICDGCKKLLRINDFILSPTDVSYHEQGCSFITQENINKPENAAQDVPGFLSHEELFHNEDDENTFVIETDSAPSTPKDDTSRVTNHKNWTAEQNGSVNGLVGLNQYDNANFSGSQTISAEVGDKFEKQTNLTAALKQRHEGQSATTDIKELEEDPKHQLSVPKSSYSRSSSTSSSSSGSSNSSGYDSNDDDLTREQFDHISSSVFDNASMSRSHLDPSSSSACRDPSVPSAPSETSNAPSETNISAAGGGASVSCNSSDPSFSQSYASDADVANFQPEFDICKDTIQNSKEACEKNRGHFAFFSIGKFQPDYIPSNVRCADVLRFFMLVAKLTVRIIVTGVSKYRKNVDYQTNETKYRFGTGFAVAQPGECYQIPSSEYPNKWDTVKKYLHCKRKNGLIYIETNRHLVYDDFEAQNTTVEFFYDKPNRKGIICAKGVSISHSSILGDLKSVLICKTSDISLMNMVKESRAEIETLAKNFPQKVKEGMMKRIFIVSHPHGREKVFCYGDYVMVKYAMEKENVNGKTASKMVKIQNHTQIPQNPDEVRKILMYTADTCNGCIGAPVVSFKKTAEDVIVLDFWMHNGVDKKHGLNASTMRVLTQDDIATHGRPNTIRPAVQEIMEAEAERAANQVVSCPVFTVFKPPSHPAYAAYRKRLESYPSLFSHVHTAEDLADAGFFYAGYADCVRCFQCGLGLRSWRAGDIIQEEHKKNRPECQFLQLKMREAGTPSREFQSNNIQNSTQSGSAGPITGASHEDPKLLMDVQTPGMTYPVAHNENGRDAVQTKLHEIVSGLYNYHPGQSVKLTVGTVMNHSTRIAHQENGSNTEVQKSFSQIPNGHHSHLEEAVQNSGSSPTPAARKSSTVAVLEREQKYLKQNLICKVCFRNTIKDLFLPCGELVACADCSKLLTECPTCGKKILATVTTYFS